MKKIWKTGLLILVALCLLITNVAAVDTYEIADNFQNHPANSLPAYFDNVDYTCPWTPLAQAGGNSPKFADVYVTSCVYSDTFAVYMRAYTYYHDSSAHTYLFGEKSINKIKYLSFIIPSASVSGPGVCRIMVYFYDSNDVEITHTSNMVVGTQMQIGDHVELLKSGDSIALYVNGAYISSVASGVDDDIYSIMMAGPYKTSQGDPRQVNLCLDDVSVNNYLIGTFPQNWSVKRYWENPTANGLYNNGDVKIYTHDFHTSYTYRNITAYEPADSIVTKYAFTDEIVNTTTLSKSADMITYNLTSMLFHEDHYEDQYGLYKQQLMQGTSILAEDFFWVDFESALKPSTNSTLRFDEDTYVAGETMTLTWHLEDTDFSKYFFKGYIYNTDTWEQKETWTIGSNDGSKEVETATGYSEGNYLALLRAESRSTSWATDLDWDVANIAKEMLVEGVTYDAETDSALGSVNVTYTQQSTEYSTTSGASTGAYNISGMSIAINGEVNATKTNYVHNDFSFTPLVKGKYDIDLFLLPDADNINHSNASIGGLVMDSPFHQSIPGATVNLWKKTIWNASTTTSNTGYYVFDDLPMNTTSINNETFNSSAYGSWIQLNYTNIAFDLENVTNTTDETPFVRNTDYEMNYTDGKIKVLETGNMVNYTDYHIDYNYEVDTIFYINATKGGLYIDSDTEAVMVSPKNYTYRYIVLGQSYNLTIYAKNVYSSTTITSFTAIVDGGTPQNTTSGAINFTVGFGFHTVEVSATGYTTGVDNEVYVAEDTEKTIYLTKEYEGGAGEYYAATHRVDFKVVTWVGQPITDVSVTAQGYQITHPESWLYSVFGYKEETALYNTSMAGTTDSGGGITFFMVDTIKYEMTFTKGSTVNETLYIFPKEDHYKIVVGGASWVETESMWDVVNYSILVNEIPGNDTHSYINFSYIDVNSATTEVYYFINQSNPTNGTTSFNIYNHTYTGGDCANIANSYIVERGEAYLIGFVGQNDDYGEIKYSITVRIFEKAKRLLEFENVPAYIYTYISLGSLMLVAAFFGMVTVPEGSIVICLEGWILWYIGWFLFENPLAPLYLTTATLFAVLIIYTAKGRSKGVS